MGLYNMLLPESPYVFYDNDRGYCINTADVLTLIAQLSMTGHWVPCSERLPKKTGWYAVIDDSGGAKFVETSYYREEDGLNPFWEFVNPVAWMSIEIPEPYREGE